MSISENAVREAVGRAVDLIDSRLRAALRHLPDVADFSNTAGFARGVASARQHDLDIIRRELADYLPEPKPCGCGNPAIGQDRTGAPICQGCQALESAAYAALQSVIPTQPTRSDR